MKASIQIEVKKLSVRKNNKYLLKDIDITIYRDCINAIIGPNGAGKTTLLHTILNLCPYEGEIIFHTPSPTRIGYVPQKLKFNHSMPITVIDFMGLTQQRRPLWMGISKAVRKKSIELLSKVSAEKLQNELLAKLSGGELQRVLLALALANDPEVILLDEPVSGVDIGGEEAFCKLLVQLTKEKGASIVLVSHDLSMVTSHAEHVICINKTLQCEGGVVEVLTQENMEKAYGLKQALYTHDKECQIHSKECLMTKKCKRDG